MSVDETAGALEYTRNILAILESNPESIHRWTAPGLLSYLIRKELDMGDDDVSREKSNAYAQAIIAGHARSVMNLTGLSIDRLEEIRDEATTEVECAWNERPKLRLKPGKTEDVTDGQGNVIMQPVERAGEVLKDKDGNPRLFPKQNILSWMHQLVKVRLPYLDQARIIAGVHPREGYKFGAQVIADILRDLSTIEETEREQEREEKRIRSRTIRRERAREMRAEFRTIEDSWEFQRLVDCVL